MSSVVMLLVGCGGGSERGDAPPSADGPRHSDARVDAARADARIDAADPDAAPDAGPDATRPKASAIAAGGAHTCALLETGAVRCWGTNEFGQLGYGNTIRIGDNETPDTVGNVDVGGNVTALAAGAQQTCAVLDTGTVRCWGANDYGQLGYGTTSNVGDNETPASAGDIDVGGIVTDVAVGEYHACALLDTGKVTCWGLGLYGRLGYGNETMIGDDETPATVGPVPITGTVKQVVAGLGHTCVLLDTGAVRCWGMNNIGQLGYGNTEYIGDDETAAVAGDVDVGGTVVQLTAGDTHTCALLDTGAVRCWGDGWFSELGYGNMNSVGDDGPPSAAGDVPIGGTVVQISARIYHTCVLLDTGAVRCWGLNWGGDLGYGNLDDIGGFTIPATAGDVDVGGPATFVRAGGAHTCALLPSGAVRCWGTGEYGALGYGNPSDIGDNETPATAGDVPL